MRGFENVHLYVTDMGVTFVIEVANNLDDVFVHVPSEVA